MDEKKDVVVTDAPAGEIRNAPETAYRSFATILQGATVLMRCLDGGDVELYVHGERLSFDDGIILRWGRKRG